MVLHGLEGSIKAHSSLPGGGDTSGTHSAFPFAPRNLQPPLISVLRNVKHCVESFHRRQREESRHECQLKVTVPEEDSLGTVGGVTYRINQLLDGYSIDCGCTN